MEIREVVVTGPRQVELQARQLDEPLGPHEVLIETERTFISAGTELSIYSGREPRSFQPGNWSTYPFRAGYANVGIVRGAGEEVQRVEIGQRVFSYGQHASAVIYDQDKRMIIPVPDGMDSTLAAASRMAGVAATAMMLSDIQGSPWVVVFGLGAVGNLAAQFYVNRGCRVIGVEPVASRRELAERCGISPVIGGDWPSVREALEELTGGEMAAITVDAVGHSSVVCQALEVTARHGQLILLGTPRVPVEADLTTLLSDIHYRFITLRGALEWVLPMYAPSHLPSQFAKQEMIFDWIQRGLLHIEPLISHELPPEQIEQAYEGLLNEPERYTGVALRWK